MTEEGSFPIGIIGVLYSILKFELLFEGKMKIEDFFLIRNKELFKYSNIQSNIQIFKQHKIQKQKTKKSKKEQKRVKKKPNQHSPSKYQIQSQTHAPE